MVVVLEESALATPGTAALFLALRFKFPAVSIT